MLRQRGSLLTLFRIFHYGYAPRRLKQRVIASLPTLVAWQVPYTFYVNGTEVMESLDQVVTELGERSVHQWQRWLTGATTGAL